VGAVRLPHLCAVRQIIMRPQVLAVDSLAAGLLSIAASRAHHTLVLHSLIYAQAVFVALPLEVMLAQVMLWWSSKKWLPLHQ
jgi:hypothetical protein